MKSFGLLLMILFSFLGVGQPKNVLQQTNHTFTLNNDSLTIFCEAEVFSKVDWYAEGDTIDFSGSTIVLNIYYKPDLLAIGSMPYTSFTQDTFGIGGLSLGAHTLIVNSYEHGDSLDKNFNYYEFYTLRDSDTSYFQVLSDNHISYTEKFISFYPNPAKENLTIEGLKPEDGEVEISILSLKEKTVLETTVSRTRPEVDLNDLPQGSYILKTPDAKPQIFLIQ